MSNEDRELKLAQWLQRIREAADAKETLVDYTRREGLKLSEAYRWKEQLRRAGQWPAHPSNSHKMQRRGPVSQLKPRFARVRVRAGLESALMAPLRLNVQLANGRRAELLVSDEAQLARVLKVLEQPA